MACRHYLPLHTRPPRSEALPPAADLIFQNFAKPGNNKTTRITASHIREDLQGLAQKWFHLIHTVNICCVHHADGI